MIRFLSFLGTGFSRTPRCRKTRRNVDSLTKPSDNEISVFARLFYFLNSVLHICTRNILQLNIFQSKFKIQASSSSRLVKLYYMLVTSISIFYYIFPLLFWYNTIWYCFGFAHVLTSYVIQRITLNYKIGTVIYSVYTQITVEGRVGWTGLYRLIERMVGLQISERWWFEVEQAV